ncbi:5316_t:CDS:2, partial [Cetraspora pellucida]
LKSLDNKVESNLTSLTNDGYRLAARDDFLNVSESPMNETRDEEHNKHTNFLHRLPAGYESITN